MSVESVNAELTWGNVGLALCFVLFNAVVSSCLGLGIGTSLTTAAFRCIVQLTLVAMILQRVFATENPFAVAGIICESDLVVGHFSVLHGLFFQCS